MQKLIVGALALALCGCSLFFLGDPGGDEEPKGTAPLDGGPGDATRDSSPETGLAD